MNGAKLTVAAAAALAILSSGALADDHFEGGSTLWLAQVIAFDSRPTERQLAPYGYAATGHPERIIVIDADTRWINVTRFETIELRVNGKSVVWTFDTFGTRPFPLSSVIPGVSGVTVYVEESPLYRNS